MSRHCRTARSSLLLGFVLSLGLALASPSATAAPFNVRPFNGFGSSGETPLQTILDGLTGGAVDVVAGQSNAALFTLTDDSAHATMVVEIAGYAGQNSLWIYDAADPSQRALLFGGAASSGDEIDIELTNGDLEIGGIAAGLSNLSGEFGFAIATPENKIFYTEDDLNPDGLAQAMVYLGDGVSTLNLPGDPLFTEDTAILAFEDLMRADPPCDSEKWWRCHGSGSDHDFNDMVVTLSGLNPLSPPIQPSATNPVPEPSAVAVFALGAMVVGGAVRRRNRD